VLLPILCSGCIWGAAAVVGVAVVGANVNEYQESQVPGNATQDLDEHLEQRRIEDEAMDRGNKYPAPAIDTDEIIDIYSNPPIQE